MIILCCLRRGDIDGGTLSYTDWLKRKTDESAHNEVLAFLTVILGINITLGGLIVTIIMIGGPNFFVFLTQRPIDLSVALGPVLTFVGFFITSVGFVLTFYHDRKRAWYQGEIQKSSIYEKKKSGAKTPEEVLQEYIHRKQS
jgi:hypothetical protein